MKPLSQALKGLDKQLLNTVWRYQQRGYISAKISGKIEKLRKDLEKLTSELEKNGN